MANNVSEGSIYAGYTPAAAAVLGLENRLAGRAQALLGVAANTLHSYFADLQVSRTITDLTAFSGQYIQGLAFNGGGTYSVTSSTTETGGIVKQRTGTGAGASSNCYSTVTLANNTTGIGYVAFRARFPLAMDAQTVSCWSVIDSGNAMQFGVGQVGSKSTTQIVLFYDNAGGTGVSGGSSVNLLADDTAWHVYEVWYGAGKIHVAVDGVEVGTGYTMAAPTTDVLSLWARLTNGTTAADRGLDSDWVYMASTFAP